MPAPQAKWSSFRWGGSKWGAGAPSGVAVQSEQANALRSTVVLGLNSTPETDLSQYLTNLTASTVGAYETSSARGAITSPRTLYVRTTVNPGTHTVRTLLYHGTTNLSDYTYAITLDLSGDLDFAQNAGSLLSIAASTFAAGDLDLSIQWSTRTNPDTTGASDAVISEVAIYDHTSSVWHHFPLFTHAISTTDVTWNLSAGGYWDGAAFQQAAPNDIVKWRVDGADYSTTHLGAHWVAGRTDGAPSDCVEKAEPVYPDKASGYGDQNEFVGPQPFAVAKAQREHQYRMLSPLVNEAYGAGATTLTNGYAPAAWHKKPVGSTVYRWNLAWLRWCVVPDNCNFIFTRVQIHSTVSSGASVPVGIRVYSFNRIPVLGKQAYEGQEPPAYEHYFAEEVLDADHTTGVGAWVVNGLVRIARNTHPHPKFTNTTHLCIAYAIDPASASANDAAEQLQVQAWQAWPVASLVDGQNIPPGGEGGMQIDMG